MKKGVGPGMTLHPRKKVGILFASFDGRSPYAGGVSSQETYYRPSQNTTDIG